MPQSSILRTLFVLLLVAGPSQAQWHRHWFQEEQSLTLDARHLALRCEDEMSGRAALNALGHDDCSLERWPVPGWWLVTFTDTPPGDADLRALVQALSLRSEISFAAPVFVGLDGGQVWPTDEILARCASQRSNDATAASLEVDGRFVILEENWGGLPGCYRLGSGSRSGIEVLDRANALARSRQFEFAEPNWIFTGLKDSIPVDAKFDQQWYLDYPLPIALLTSDLDCDAPETWELSTGNPSIVVAIVDDGIQYDHPDLPRGIRGTDTTSPQGGTGAAINSWDNHGTVVAGVIAATMNNGHGVAGLVPEVTLLSIRAYVSFSYYGFTAMTSWTVPALDWAMTQGAQVTNHSVTLGMMDSATTAKYDQLRQNGILHYASAGNDPVVGTSWPANLASVHGVTGIDFVGDIAGFASFGPNMDYAAGAAFIYSTDRTGNLGFNTMLTYAPLAGTTFSGAYGAAQGALALSVNPGLTANQVDDVLAATCMDLGAPGFDPMYANGLLNAYAIAWQSALLRPDPESVLFRQNAPSVGSAYGQSMTGLGDIDGDGRGDFAVGSPLDDQAGLNAGIVEFRSGASGQVIFSVTGMSAGEGFGRHLCALGDLNGDGVRELAVTDPAASPGGLPLSGRVRIHSGASGALLHQINGSVAGSRLGQAICDLGDLNGDGADDFALGLPNASVMGTVGVGRVEIRSGADASLILPIEGQPGAGDLEFGYSLCATEDRDADGKLDLVVGIPGANTIGTDGGRLRIVSSGTGAVLTTMETFQTGARLGTEVVSWIDLNDDGQIDIAAAAPNANALGPNTGAVLVYSPATQSAIAGWVGANAQARFGSFLRVSPDMDGDTFADLVVGAPGQTDLEAGAGAIHVYSKYWARPRYTLRGGKPGDAFGTSAAVLGDIDGDGRAEIAVSALGNGTLQAPGWTAILPASNPANLSTLPAGATGAVRTAAGKVHDVLLVNGSGGGLDRTVRIGVGQEIRVGVVPPVDSTTPANFAVWAYLGLPSLSQSLTLPANSGELLFLPCTVGGGGNFVVTNNYGADPCGEFVPSTVAPWHSSAPNGLPFPFTLVYQGVITDGPGTAKATNAVKVVIQ